LAAAKKRQQYLTIVDEVFQKTTLNTAVKISIPQRRVAGAAVSQPPAHTHHTYTIYYNLRQKAKKNYFLFFLNY